MPPLLVCNDKPQIRKLQKERESASRKIIHLAAEARQAVRLKNPAMAAFITFEEEMGAIDARVREGDICTCARVQKLAGGWAADY